jgi:hypothetical protein
MSTLSALFVLLFPSIKDTEKSFMSYQLKFTCPFSFNVQSPAFITEKKEDIFLHDISLSSIVSAYQF